MWMVTPLGAFSIRCSPADMRNGTLTIESKVRSDLEALMAAVLPSACPIVEVLSKSRGYMIRCGRGEIAPRLGRLDAVLLEQVLSIIHETRVGIDRHGDQLAVAGVVLDDGGEVILLGPFRIGREIDEMRAEDAGPDRIDLEDVDVAGAGREQLLVEGEPFRGRVRRRDDLDGVAGLLGPALGQALADVELLADRTARDGDGLGPGGADETDEGQQGHAGERQRACTDCGSVIHRVPPLFRPPDVFRRDGCGRIVVRPNDESLDVGSASERLLVQGQGNTTERR